MEKKVIIQSKDPLRNYDALQDKHASFYFNGYGVKKHLRKLKKVYVHPYRPSRWNHRIEHSSSTLPCWHKNSAKLTKKPKQINARFSHTNKP